MAKPKSMFQSMLRSYTTDHLRKTLPLVEAMQDMEEDQRQSMVKEIKDEIELRERCA